MLSRLLGSVGLIAGTSIGAGMLAMPMSTAHMGFIPSLLALILVAGVMIYMGFVIVESLSRMKEHTTLISMAEETLGIPGRIISIFSYIFLLFALNASYLGLASSLIAGVISENVSSTHTICVSVGLLTVLGVFVASKVEYIDRFNRFLVLGLIITYLILNGLVFPHIKLEYVQRMQFSSWMLPLPLIATAFGYHIILPNIFDYLKRDLRQTKLAIVLGSSIPLAVYSIWQLSVLGTVPYGGEFGLQQAFESGTSATVPLIHAIHNDYLNILASAFSFFAIMTSFLGTFLGIVEFLSDAFSVKQGWRQQVCMTLIAAIPIFLFNIYVSRVFLVALGYAGIMVAILIGLLPLLMTYRSRKIHQNNLGYVTYGGNAAMILAALFFMALIFTELGCI